MSIKLFVVFAALCAVLLATQTAYCASVDVQQPEELNQDAEVIVTYPLGSSEEMFGQVLGADDRSVAACNSRQCQQLCRSLGYRYGRCSNKARCICSNN